MDGISIKENRYINKFFEIDKKSKVEKEINLIDETKFHFDNKKMIKNMLSDELVKVRQILFKIYEVTQEVVSHAKDYILGRKNFDFVFVKENCQKLKNFARKIVKNTSKIMDFIH